MDKYKIIIMQTIAFGIKSYLTILRNIFSNLSSPSKSTSRIVLTKKNSFIDSTENMRKVGEFKQYIYKFIQQLKKAEYDQNLYLFLYGQLFQYIYRIDELINDKISMTPEQFKEKIISFGIDFNMSDSDIEIKSKQIMEILTDKKKSIRLKERFFGLFKPKEEKLKNNAKKIITTSYDPEALKAHWWVNIERKYLKISGNRKLFVIAIQPVISAGKFSKLNVWLIDVFATAQSSTKPTLRNMGIKTFEQVDKNGVVIKEYYGDNNLIMLNPWMRTMREFKGDFQKWSTKNTKWWGEDPSGWKKSLQTFFQNKSKKLQKSEIGSLFAEYLGIRKQKDDGGFKNSELIMRLIQGKLDSYVQNNNNNNRSSKIKPAILMGYDEDQLIRILITHLGAMKRKNRFAKNANSYNDWQLYLIQEKDYSSVESFRMWAFNLLMSKPWVFNEENMKNKYSIPLSNFSKMQVPFKNFFIKTGDFGISSDLLTFFKLITDEKFKEIKNLNSNKKNWVAMLKENKNFITQTELSELEMPRNNMEIGINNGVSKVFTRIEKNNNRAANTRNSTVPASSSVVVPNGSNMSDPNIINIVSTPFYNFFVKNVTDVNSFITKAIKKVLGRNEYIVLKYIGSSRRPVLEIKCRILPNSSISFYIEVAVNYTNLTVDIKQERDKYVARPTSSTSSLSFSSYSSSSPDKTYNFLENGTINLEEKASSAYSVIYELRLDSDQGNGYSFQRGTFV
jgi:uncharacterized protein YjfI (DUF2170 family)